MGTVIQFPVVPELAKTCFACKHAMFGESGTYCPVFEELIWSEKLAASDCEVFERVSSP
jgi:uncharacterized Zn finger protein (UPF0148 family)